MLRRVSNLLLSTLLVLIAGPAAFGQLSLSGSGTYTQGFNSIGSGLPTGWTVRVFANATSLGTDVSATNYNRFNTSWGTSTSQFANYASALNPGLIGNESSATQNVLNDRALGLRQDSSFGDPGGAFTLQLANTSGFRDFTLSFSAQLLDIETRNTPYTIRYGVGATPAGFTDLGTIATDTLNGNTFGEDPFTVGPATLAAINDVNDTVWIQVVTLSNSTGSGSSRDTFAIDNFQLTYTPVPEPGAVLVLAAAGLGLAGLVRRRHPTS